MNYNEFVIKMLQEGGWLLDDNQTVVCPECGEPIFEEDYVHDNMCPVCEMELGD